MWRALPAGAPQHRAATPNPPPLQLRTWHSAHATCGRGHHQTCRASPAPRPKRQRKLKQQPRQAARPAPSPTQQENPSPGTCQPGQAWRVFQVVVPYTVDPGKDDISVHDALRTAVVKRLGCRSSLPPAAISLVRKSFDARPAIKGVRTEKRWVYVVDVDAAALTAAGGARLSPSPGQLELLEPNPNPKPDPNYQSPPAQRPPGGIGPAAASDATARGIRGRGEGMQQDGDGSPAMVDAAAVKQALHPVIVVGSGPAGLFAALTAAQAGLPVVVLERGRPVEQRGKDIGALLVRGFLNPDSNLCYGEGGAGTWSDGKLATKIGRNADPVRGVLQALVEFGAPESILVAGKPHLGTDRLVGILKRLRHHLLHALGAKVLFNTVVEDLEVRHGRVTGVRLAGSGDVLAASAVVLAVGHSARAMYRRLHAHGAAMTSKPFAMGFRVEHPQALIDAARYGADAVDVQRGAGRIPVADYKLAVEVPDDTWQGGGGAGGDAAGRGTESSASGAWGPGVEEYGGVSAGRSVPPGQRSVFSFCMCPGGQIVCTSTSPEELCLNGMSFSRRNSVWANSALVVNVGPRDWARHAPAEGVLAGVAFQEEMEREAARRGGGGLVAPVQRVADFLAAVPSTGNLPSSSYRLGVRSAPLHDLYPPFVSAALSKALARFERSIPGFASSPDALLHGIEARTSSPIRLDRHPDTLESLSLPGLFPSGEGAGYAGGIVSAAVDGVRVGHAVAAALLTRSGAALL